MPGKGVPFGKGNRANPHGRPRGVRELVPRGFVRRLVAGVLSGNVKQVEEALRRAATNPRTVVAVLDFAAKLNKEIGSGADAGGGTTIINLYSNLDMSKLRKAAPRAAQPVSVEAAAPPRCLPRVPRVSEQYPDQGSARGGR